MRHGLSKGLSTLLALALAMTVVAVSAQPAPRSATVPDVWVDADPGCGGAFYADVDDCWALFHAWAMGGERIAGISTVFGNVSGSDAARFARGWMQQLSAAHPLKKMPAIHEGRAQALVNAPHPSSSGEAALAAFLDGFALTPASGGATLLMLGPVSNLASVLQQKPARATVIRRVIMLGGQPPGMSHWLAVNGRLRMRDYNVFKDPQAMAVVLKAGVAIDFVPVQAAFGYWLNADRLRTEVSGQPALQWLTDVGMAWERFWRWGFATPGYPPFDLLASGLLFQPERFFCTEVNARMAMFPSITGDAPGLELAPPAPSQPRAADSRHRRCRLASGDAVDLIRAARDTLNAR